MAEIKRSPSENHFLYVGDVHMEGKWIPIHTKKDFLTIIKLASDMHVMVFNVKTDSLIKM